MILCQPTLFLKNLFLLAMLTNCTASGTHNPQHPLTSIDIDEVEGVPAAKTFARLCMAQNSSITQLVTNAKNDGWRDAQDEILQKHNLNNLRRHTLEIPGGGGRYRETQTILNSQTETLNLIANLMERFDRNEKLVRTECALYALEQDHLPICAAVGLLLKRPPDSNQRFNQTKSHFIRWQINIAGKQANIRCEGLGTVAIAREKTQINSEQNRVEKSFKGTVISTIVDQVTQIKSSIASAPANPVPSP